jgi:MFS transporter, DHA1 family, tetracycline resistance protein
MNMSEPTELIELPLLRRTLLPLICIVVFLDFLAAGMLIPLIPALVRQFTPQAFAVGLTFTAFAIGQFMVSPLLGVLSDRYGRRLIFLISTIGGMLACWVLGVASSIELILASRFLDGLTGGNLIAGQAYIADITSPERRAKNFGMLGASVGLGFIFGPALGGLFSRVNLQLPVFVAGLLYLLTAILIWCKLPESLPPSRRSQDPIQWAALNPLTQLLQALQRPPLRLLLLVVFLLNFAESGLRSNLQVLTAERFSLAIGQNAILFSYLGLIIVLVQGIAIRPLVRRYPERALTIVGLGFMIIGYSGIAFAPSVGLLYAALTFNAIGFGLTSPTLLSSLSNEVSEKEQGFIIGASQAIASLTLILSPALAGLKFDRLGTGAPYWTGAILLSLAALTFFQHHRSLKP